MAKAAPKSEKNAMLSAMDATAKRGSRKYERSSIGSGVRSSQAANAVASSTEAAKQPRVTGSSQPRPGASITP